MNLNPLLVMKVRLKLPDGTSRSLNKRLSTAQSMKCEVSGALKISIFTNGQSVQEIYSMGSIEATGYLSHPSLSESSEEKSPITCSPMPTSKAKSTEPQK